MKRHRKNKRIKIEYWQSYSDVMAALLIVFILIVFVSVQRVREQEADIIAKYEEIKRQKIALEEQEIIAKNMEEKISKIIGVKAEIIEELKKVLENEELKIDEQTGAIQFDSEILFDKNKHNLKKIGEKQLDTFLNGYLKVLLSDRFINNISEIIVEGHTDTDGDYDYNLQLSQLRSLTVVKYCLNNKKLKLSNEQKEHLRKIITANGKSFSHPILDKNGEIDKEASRRVVFQFRLKDEEMIQQLQEILNE